MSKTAEEILDNFITVNIESLHSAIPTKKLVLLAMKEYARIIVDEQLEIAADEARVESETPIGKYYAEYSVDKDTIIDCTRVLLK